MIIQALIKYLKENSSITNVVPAGMDVNTGGGRLPYVRVFEKRQYGSGRGASDNSVTSIIVQVCYPKNYNNDLDKYMLFELFSLVDNKLLTIVYDAGPPIVSCVVQMHCTNEMSELLPLDNSYIYRERTVIIPERWR